MKHVMFLQPAHQQIAEEILAANNKYEVGGVLVGYQILGDYIIVAATAQENAQEQTRTRVTLDGTYHTHLVESVCKEYLIKPKVVGIWHSHIYGEAVFSVQDKESNKLFAQINGGAISTIVMKHKDFSWISYYVAPKGESELCKTLTIKRVWPVCWLLKCKRR